jgi:competence protein ComEC
MDKLRSVRNYILPGVVFILLFSNVFVWREAFSPQTRKTTLKVFYLNIGQGDATLIEAPNGNQVLIDGGPTDNKVLTELGAVLSPLDHDIDVVIATHPDADHVGGLPEVLSRYKVGMFLESGNRTKDTQAFKRLDTEAVKLGNQRVIAKRGMRLVLDEEDGVALDILYPDKDVTYVESNEASIVARLTYGSTHFIFSGDAPRDIEQHLTQLDGTGLESDVLKAGHHGSHTSSDPTYVQTVHPSIAVISVGKDNRYGHPHKETLATFNALHIETLRTDNLGRIEIDSDGSKVSVK